MIKRLCIALLFSLSLSAHADIQDDPNQIQRIYNDLAQLKQYGIELHQSYNTNNTADLQACVKSYGPLRTQAKQLQLEIKNLNDPINRMPLAYPADLAFQCVYCGGKIKSCQQLEARLIKSKKRLGL